MRLLPVLSALVAFAEATQDHRGLRAQLSTNSKCTSSQTEMFLDNLDDASDGCMLSTSYVWDGSPDPTDSQRAAVCKCTVSPFDAPKCYYTKLGQWNIDTDTSTASGTGAEERDAETTESSTETETSADCTVTQLNAFTAALNTASSGCTANSTYNGGGNANPTDVQYSEICKCAAVTASMIPACYIEKDVDRLSTEGPLKPGHFGAVLHLLSFVGSYSTTTTTTKKKSTNVGLIVGSSGIVVAVAAAVIIYILFSNKRKSDNKTDQQQYQRHTD